MRVAHFDCFSGISGDMALGACLDAGVPVDVVRAALDSLGLPITLEVEKVKRCGFACTKATVHAEDQEDYRFLPDVAAILARGTLTDAQRSLATRIFEAVARAESAAHGMPLERVHFHEVGALDSIADIVGVAVALDHLGRRAVHEFERPHRDGDREVRPRRHARPRARHRGTPEGRAARQVER